jgi:phenylalanyl-tRNA synthetase beta subunit
MTIFDTEHEPPEPGPGDQVSAVVRAALGAIPILGQAAQELLHHVITPPLARRQQEWMNDVAETLRQLEATDQIDVQNPVFIDTLLTASQQAMRTSQKAKLEALLSATLNSALSHHGLSVVQQQVFLALVERYTDLHLMLLKMFDEPSNWQSKDGRRVDKKGAVEYVWSVFPDLQSELAHSVWAELHRDGLVTTPEIKNGLEGGVVRRTTSYGRAFLTYITHPIGDRTL